MSDTPARFTLRQLPLPAKIVVTAFLFAVGLGYVSAMVQLHDKHSSKDGNPLPSPADVVEVFSGLKKPDPNAPPPFARIDTLLSGDAKATDVSKDNMAPAFFAKSKGWATAGRGRDGVSLEAQREGERLAMLAWVRCPDPAAKKAAYEADAFALPDGLKGEPITPEFQTAGKELKIKSLIDARCQNCHKDQPPELASFAALESLVTPPSQELIDGRWVRSARQVGKEKLIQSTHAHLLTFAILFGLTGLTFAFTGYPAALRCVLAPVVLIAQVADVSCWWLARMDAPYGPLFAQSIVGTGAVVGLGLVLQIVLSLLSMYGPKGRLVMLALMVVIGGGLGYVAKEVIQPALDREKEEKDKAAAKPSDPVKTPNGTPKVGDPPAPEVSHLERLVMGSRDTAVAPWNGKGSMSRAFFENESRFKKLVATKSPELPKVEAERQTEQLAIQAWIRADPAARKKAYEEDKFPLPAPLQGKPLTEEYADGGKFAKVKSILNDRCARCHAEGEEQADFPLQTYEQLMKYLDAKPAGAVIPPAKGD